MIADALNFAGKITPRRAVNVIKVLASYYMARLFQKPIHWGMPFTVSIEPTTACNLRCPECPSGLRAFSRPTGNLRGDFFRKMTDELAPDLLYMIFYFQGEPYINPEFLDMVKYAHARRIYTITSTNGHFLDDAHARRTVESGLDRLIISIDGSTQEVYEQYRKGGQLSKVLEGAVNVVRWKKLLRSKTPHIIFQCLVVKPNESQIPEIFELGRRIGVDEVKLKTAQIYDYHKGHPLIPTQEKYSRYKRQDNGAYTLKYGLLNHCWKLWHACVITWNGMVVPCCFDKDAAHPLGSLREFTFREIWKGAAIRDFRSRILMGRDKIDICSNCSEGCKVWL
jgi:radical SAM protein with 4Fe4S-binding SPASM domain